MNKIGFAIKITSQGAGQPIAVNGGDWVQHVVDIRDLLKHIPSMEEDYKRSILFFSFDESGCYITVAHTISGRRATTWQVGSTFRVRLSLTEEGLTS